MVAHANATILVVDDEEANVLLLERMLARAGYEAITATTDSRQVSDLAGSLSPDIILLDLMMPHKDGYEVMAELLAMRREGEFLPILVLTADTTKRALERALTEGATDFLTKPFDQTELLLRVHNLLESRFLNRALQQQLQVLDEINHEVTRSVLQRDESISLVSHDLGQPLVALRLTVESLQEDLSTTRDVDIARIRDDMELIAEATAQLTALISGLSDLVRLQMGRELVLNVQPMDLSLLLKKQIALAKTANKGHRFTDNVPKGAVGVVGRWDEVRLTRVVLNLLSNAAKFSPKGSEIVVDLEPHQETGSVILRVTDKGRGIPPEELDRVSQAFFRASNTASLVPGTGLGLASTRQIVEQHGGKLKIDSVLDAGTTVHIELPWPH